MATALDAGVAWSAVRHQSAVRSHRAGTTLWLTHSPTDGEYVGPPWNNDIKGEKNVRYLARSLNGMHRRWPRRPGARRPDRHVAHRERQLARQNQNCGGALCGNVVWLKEPNDPETGKPKLDKKNADEAKRSRAMLGVPIVLGMKPNGPGKWSGEVYNAGDGKTYSGSITERDANAILLEGCVLGVFCKAQTWNRVK